MVKNQIEVSPELFSYIINKTLVEPKELKLISTEQSSIDDVILQITPHQGQFIALLIKLINPNKTLDIGTYKGYSALCVALASNPNCKIISIDNNKGYSEIAKDYWRKSGVEDKITLKLGHASDILNELIMDGQAQSFDFIFIDADKANYLTYFEYSLKLLKKGGLIAIDNTLYFGTVINTIITDKDIMRWVFEDGIKAIKTLNEIIKNDNRVESCLLPIADGLTLVRKI